MSMGIGQKFDSDLRRLGARTRFGKRWARRRRRRRCLCTELSQLRLIFDPPPSQVAFHAELEVLEEVLQLGQLEVLLGS
jgi:hypothetical protein